MSAYAYIGRILGVREEKLEELDRMMAARTSKRRVFERMREENEKNFRAVLAHLEITKPSPSRVREALHQAILAHEKQLLEYLMTVEGKTEFEKAATLARRIGKVKKGFFLKKEYAREILRRRRPDNLLKFFGFSDVETLFAKSDVMEAFSALRFVETDEWMHKTFEETYSNFTLNDFEEREIEVKALGSEWQKIAEKFVAKKHHNVSHLKEFGVIFLNPIKEDTPGKFLRDFALLLHYFHEIEFYSKLFRQYAVGNDFPLRFKAFLRGDVKEVSAVGAGEWLIVQRYLFKENPRDPRLCLPRVNPESMHWARGQKDLINFAASEMALDLEMWRDLDWVALLFDKEGELVSFDIEDNAMSAVSLAEGRQEFFTYHQREAMWTKLFSHYAGGEEAMERLLLSNFDKGAIQF